MGELLVLRIVAARPALPPTAWELHKAAAPGAQLLNLRVSPLSLLLLSGPYVILTGALPGGYHESLNREVH